MVVTQTYTKNQINERIYTHTLAMLRGMASEHLVDELKRVEADLRKLNAVLGENPTWLTRAPNLRKYKNALNGEKRRIGKVLNERARALLSSSSGTFPLGETMAVRREVSNG